MCIVIGNVIGSVIGAGVGLALGWLYLRRDNRRWRRDRQR